jgi:uncharacterized protein (TIGR00251 family)
VPAWYRKTADGWLLTLHIQPGAKKSEVVGLHGDALKVRVASPPVDGKANEALVAFIAAQFGLPKRAVQLVKGDTSRAKTVLVMSVEADPVLLLTGKT